MIRVFLDNVEISDRVEIDLSFVEKLDMELDEGFLVIAHSTKSDPYDMFSTIDVYEDNEIIFTGKISQDNVSLSSFADELYNHSITIIEHTKILEKYIVTGKTFTQPTDDTSVPFYTLFDVVDSLRKTTNFSLFGNEEVNTPFEIPQEVEDELDAIIAPEFSFKDVTLRQALDEVFFYIDSIVRLDRDKNLVIEKFNELNNEIDFLTENYKRDQNISNYSTVMSSDVQNAVNTGIGFTKYNYEYYPGKDLWTSLRSNTLTQFNFETSVIPTPKPIYDVEQLLTVADIRIVSSDSETPEGATIEELFDNDFYSLDISTNLVEKSIYNTLEERNPNSYDDLTKRNVLYYEYGRKGIQVGETYGVFDINTVFPLLIESTSKRFAFENNHIPSDATEVTPPSGFDYAYEKDGLYYWMSATFLGSIDDTLTLSRWESLFRVKYTPIVPSIRYEVVRDDVSEVFVDTKSIANQKLRIVDLERFTNNMKGRINQLSNSQLVLSHKVSTIDETYNVGDFNIDKFIITKKEVIVQRDHYIVNYELNKNFNKMSQFMGIDQEIRQYEIGESGRTLDRDLNYNEYVEIYADDVGQSNTGSSTLIQPSILLNTLNPSYNAVNFAKYSVFTSPQLLDDDNNQIAINLPIYRVSGGNAFGFYMDFETNASAGDVLLQGGDGFLNPEALRRYNVPLKYTDEIGRLESFLVSVHDGTLFPEVDFNAEIDVANALPEFTKTLSNQFMSGSFYLDKDNRERIKMTFLYHLLSKNINEVVIGELLSTNNAFFIEESNTVQLRAWNNREFVIRDKNRKLTDEDLIVTNPSITFDYNNNYFEINEDISTYNSWALTDGDGYPYIMVNSNKVRIVFEFKSFRSDVDYGGQVPEGNLQRPTLVTSSSTSDSVTFVLGNPNAEDVDIEVTLGQDTQTQEVLLESQSTNFTFTNLEPNTNFTVVTKCVPKLDSVLNESQQRTFSERTQIIPIDPPTAVEKRVESYEAFGSTYYTAIYDVTNNDDTFVLDVYHEIDGYLDKTNAGVGLNPGQTVELGVSLLGPDQTIPENRLVSDVSYPIRFRTRTKTFNNNWDSPFTNFTNLFIGELDPPNYGTAQVTDTTASVSWGNPNNVDTQIEVQLLSAPFPQGTVEQTITQSISAQGGTTINFTGLDDDTFYNTRAKLIGTGFNIDSQTADGTSFQTDITRTATPRIQNVERTTSTIDFELVNQDPDVADIYWNTTGSPDETDNVFNNVSSGGVVSDQITGLNEAEIVTIYYRAKSDARPISTQGQSTTQTFRQLQAPTFSGLGVSVTETTMSVSFGNPNGVDVTMSGYVSILGNIIDTDTVFVDANSSNSLSFSNLSPDTSYVVTAKFEASGINLESASTTTSSIKTLQEVMATPTINIIDVGTTTVTFELTNNEPNTTATVQYGVDGDFSQTATVTTNTTLGISGLTSNTDYMLNAKVDNNDFRPSEAAELEFTTDGIPASQWVYIGTSGQEDETTAGTPSPIPTTCPTDEQEALGILNDKIPPNTRFIGHVVRVTRLAGSPLRSCDSRFFEAQ